MGFCCVFVQLTHWLSCPAHVNVYSFTTYDCWLAVQYISCSLAIGSLPLAHNRRSPLHFPSYSCRHHNYHPGLHILPPTIFHLLSLSRLHFSLHSHILPTLLSHPRLSLRPITLNGQGQEVGVAVISSALLSASV